MTMRSPELGQRPGQCSTGTSADAAENLFIQLIDIVNVVEVDIHLQLSNKSFTQTHLALWEPILMRQRAGGALTTVLPCYIMKECCVKQLPGCLAASLLMVASLWVTLSLTMPF